MIDFIPFRNLHCFFIIFIQYKMTMKYEFFLISLFQLVLQLPSISSTSHLTTFDPTCKHTEKNIYEIDFNEEEIRKVSLFRKDHRLESYVGYPCNLALYEKYVQNFRKKALECPFKGNLDTNFQTFIWTDLWNTSQTSFDNSSDPSTQQNSSLLFQYICFSNQFEKCVLNQDKANLRGTCDGICECEDAVPVEPYNYPKITSTKNNRPVILEENEIRCGVRAGGLCFPVWDLKCKENEKGYNKSLEGMYNKKDFYFKCESNAGCHTAKRICECAQGHQCGGSGGQGGKYHLLWWIFWMTFNYFIFFE